MSYIKTGISCLTFRKLSGIGLLICAFALIGSYITEHVFYVLPCQLCVLQRYIFFILTFIFLLGFLHDPKKRLYYLYAIKVLFFTFLGMVVAGRQIWFQYLPPGEVTECLPRLERLFELYPILEAFKMLLNAPGDCVKVHFSIFGLPMFYWSFFAFVLLFFLGLSFICMAKKKVK